MSKVLLDACILFPSVTRALLMGAAQQGLFEPLWSARILGEWRHTAQKHGVGPRAEIEIALLRAGWPKAEMPSDAAQEAGLVLPDVDDRHVLSAAITGGADELLTRNLKDFPPRVLAGHGIVRREPDGFLLEMVEDLHEVVAEVHQQAQEMAGEAMTVRALLKKARLPRLGKYFQ